MTDIIPVFVKVERGSRAKSWTVHREISGECLSSPDRAYSMALWVAAAWCRENERRLKRQYRTMPRKIVITVRIGPADAPLLPWLRIPTETSWIYDGHGDRVKLGHLKETLYEWSRTLRGYPAEWLAKMQEVAA